MSIPKALSTRGTPKGYYEIVRTVTANIPYANGFLQVDSFNVQTISFVFTPVEFYY
jgi:hypothetical protein